MGDPPNKYQGMKRGKDRGSGAKYLLSGDVRLVCTVHQLGKSSWIVCTEHTCTPWGGVLGLVPAPPPIPLDHPPPSGGAGGGIYKAHYKNHMISWQYVR